MSEENNSLETLQTVIPVEHAGRRLDQSIAELFPEYSREKLKSWILAGKCLLDGDIISKPREKVQEGQVVIIHAEKEAVVSWQAENLSSFLNIVHEDDDILILNKPEGLVVHPGNGNNTGTLVNALLNYLPEQELIPRAGIVHRLDKDTTGLLVVAKTLTAHKDLVEQLQNKTVKRVYHAVVNGSMVAGGEINQPIGRSNVNRTKMAIVSSGKPARTTYRVLEKFPQHTYLEIFLETGRTHQIRVHMAHIRHSIVGDKQYGRLRLIKGASEQLVEELKGFNRQALHAKKLGLEHPRTKEYLEWESDLPKDITELLKTLRAEYEGHEKV